MKVLDALPRYLHKRIGVCEVFLSYVIQDVFTSGNIPAQANKNVTSQEFNCIVEIVYFNWIIYGTDQKFKSVMGELVAYSLHVGFMYNKDNIFTL